MLVDRLDEPGGVRHRLLSLFHGREELKIDLYLDEAGGRPFSEGFTPRVALQFRKEVARLNPSVVVAHGGDAMKYAVPALAGTGRPLVYCVIGTFAGRPTPLREWVWRRLMAQATLAVAAGNEVNDECTGRFRVLRQRVVTIPYGRDPSEFTPRSGPAPAGEREPTLIFVGALTPQKQPDRFVEVVRHLRSGGRSFRAVIVGDGPLAPTLATVAPAHGIELLGPRSDIPELFRAADVFVFPSRPNGEGLPGVLIEAGLSGLPTVATPVPGVSTVICDGQTGLIVDDSVPEMASAIGRLLDDTETRVTMGAAARRRCESSFTLALMAQRWRDALQPLLTGPEA